MLNLFFINKNFILLLILFYF